MSKFLFLCLFIQIQCLYVWSAPSQRHDHFWAVLVAGSHGWSNYRHQADVCHAYHLLVERGVNPEKIIVMMYDDIAFNGQNPHPGVIINSPNGTNVYPGVPKHYTGKDVTPENLLGVLGHSQRLVNLGKKVVESGPNDHILLFFSGYGGLEKLIFPSEHLLALDLKKKLITMHDQKLYKKILLVVESCFSGSMFDKFLPSDIDAYAITSSSPDEGSSATFMDSERNTYLSNVFSYNWMHSLTDDDPNIKYVSDQFKQLLKSTNTSTVSQYGDLKLAETTLINEIEGPHYPTKL